MEKKSFQEYFDDVVNIWSEYIKEYRKFSIGLLEILEPLFYKSINIKAGAQEYVMKFFPDKAHLEKGVDTWAHVNLEADEETWNEIFLGNIGLMGAYLQRRMKIPHLREVAFILRSLNLVFMLALEKWVDVKDE
ncbi:MAG: hypothetical protein Q6366_009700 [Candidatus Freyarchaeota archaeon]